MATAKPPIAPDVADVIGNYAERVENRSLLLDKFVLHKAWPLVFLEATREPVKLDDASRWSFIRLTQNGEGVLRKELARCEREADPTRQHAKPENIEKASVKAKVLRGLITCRCRTLPPGLAAQKLMENRQFATLIEKRPGPSAAVYGELQGRLVVNLSDSLIQNAGICLDRQTGLPYIPGSAVKGVTRHVALEHLRAGDWTITEFQQAFGSSEVDFGPNGELYDFAETVRKDDYTRKGGVDFLAAQPVTEPKIVVDISNVHYPDYYQSGAPRDLAQEKPRPNTFPVVEKGVRYVFCLAANGMGISPELFDRVRALLIEAITEKGLGAKTGAGYGWFSDVTALENEAQKQAAQEEARRLEAKAAQAAEEKRRAEQAAENARLASLSDGERMLERWKKMGSVVAVLGSDIAKFEKLSDADKKGVVEALLSPGSLGAEVWTAAKASDGDKRLKRQGVPGGRDAIRAYYKAVYNPGKKMP